MSDHRFTTGIPPEELQEAINREVQLADLEAELYSAKELSNKEWIREMDSTMGQGEINTERGSIPLGGTTKPQEPSEITRQVNVLDNLIDDLPKLIHMLEQTLDPVLNQNTNSNTDETDPQESVSTHLGSHLQSISYRLKDCMRHLASVTQRIEL